VLKQLTLTKTTEIMTTAQAISNESYLKISNLSDSSDFNYAIERLKEIETTYGETKQSGLLMGRLLIKRDKLTAAGK
jgi:hypothetical protein